MGKKDKKKKDPEKKAAIAAKKEAKAEKAALKRLKKELGKEGNTEDKDDFDAILTSFQTKTDKNNIEAPIIESLNDLDSNNPFPPSRANFTLSYAPTSGDLYLFGGEYYNGVENLVYNDLFKYNPDGKNQSDDDDDDNDKEDKKQMGEWKKIISPEPTPSARCAHSAVYYNHSIYIFGGELATTAQFHHYRDFWRFDLNKNIWEEVKHRGGPSSSPSPRSGHRCVVWRHFMILFGGFYEALKETKWYQDLWVFDFATSTWTEMKYGKLAVTPEPRSAFSFAIHPSTDVAYLYGGFSKLKNPGKSDETKVHTDFWALHLKEGLLSLGKNGGSGGKMPTWERLKRKGNYPAPPRSGMGCVVHKQRMLLFGGVNDKEKDGHKLESVFYDNMYALDMEKKRWFELGLKKKKEGGRRRKKKGELEDDDDEENGNDAIKSTQNDSTDDDDDDEGEVGEREGWDLDKLRSNMFAFIDGDGNIVYEKIIDEDEENKNEEEKGYEADQGETDEKTNNDVDQSTTSQTDSEILNLGNEMANEKRNIINNDEILHPVPEMKQNNHYPINSSSILKMSEDGKPAAIETPTPLPRINASLAVKNNTLYLYGGLLEVGDRELTLDDFWSIDLQRREEWKCIWRGTMHRQVWKGVDSDLDDASYVSTGDDKFYGIDDESDEDEDHENNLLQQMNNEAEQKARKEARKAAKKEARKKEKLSLRAEITSLRSEYNLDDPNRTPQMGESLADFYARTSDYWNEKVIVTQNEAVTSGKISNQEKLSQKEMKREGFLLAKERFVELEPVLSRLNEIEEIQTSAEMNKKSSKSEKSKKKKGEHDKKKDRRR